MPKVSVGDKVVSVSWSELKWISDDIKEQMAETCAKLPNTLHYCVSCGDSYRHSPRNHSHTHVGCITMYNYCHGCGSGCGHLFCDDCSKVSGEYTLTISE